ncbi:hypothetical protein ACVC7V_22535 [Hydrogenophaga sp. A37]|uniref:hypothetical protein n=1 Tax=Hydrogenophaga sp. A37 TaxID=1945864 RepID=UPI000985522E|nr:hypothetical protein [Hydrogenophaga sp. A37]OOG85867.1 hypothetical protein B0E41_07480 [Hydrogenophaga sp. A37]
MPDTLDLTTTIFTKTPLGQQEIQTRSLGLSPLVRRTLVLVDGKRTGADLGVFLSGGADIADVLGQLLTLGCVEARETTQRAAARVPAIEPQSGPEAVLDPEGEPAAETPDSDALAALPPSDARNAKDNEMARNFMVNSVNSIFGQHMHISLVRDISEARSTEQLRTVYHAWMVSMAVHRTGSKRLPELREKLFKVL